MKVDEITEAVVCMEVKMSLFGQCVCGCCLYGRKSCGWRSRGQKCIDVIRRIANGFSMVDMKVIIEVEEIVEVVTKTEVIIKTKVVTEMEEIVEEVVILHPKKFSLS
ncbi:hypothetical protein Rs2_08346 [Raphanus sativus]|nr:hypothetical protein Rs2_08346 [Raphanus sativus]